jgi:hypothetical protein
MGVLESRIQQGLSELSCSADAFSIISDVSKTRLSRAFRGLQDFSGPEAESLLKTIADLRQIQKNALPFPTSFATRDAMAVRGLLNSYRAGVRWSLHVELDPELEPELEARQ